MKTAVLKRDLAAVVFDPLADVPELPNWCESVNAVALAHAQDRDAGWVARKRGGYADTWRERHDRGCEIIATALIKDRTPVF
ncbi:hypothetical protein EI171_22440 [Bradyrhizobium sp. LCT2]|uniref:hypothetical protein n=1 Tax=Bradyrhizobium sp. LCT2 TaxID=2493093 RepID=UPI001373AD78|nr:hypothetical protein [Bradyrhizobium sp. LCT2]QHP69810.1 hypothetical protein EI171_22440 [Bradyrhizobium sp. LCT2]